MNVFQVVLLIAVSQALVAAKTLEGRGAAGEDFDALKYLERAGYLDDLPSGHRHHAPDNVKQALKEFQAYYSLPVTGRLDKDTVTLMKKPRCGFPDVIKPSQRPQNQTDDGPQAYVFLGTRWNNHHLTYKFNSFSRKMTQSSQIKAIADALQMWSNVSPLTFTRRTYGRVDMDLMFASGQHGDRDPFDGPYGVLAHATQPGNYPGAGDLHFDADENWIASGDYQGRTSLESVAAHEFGHALGLGHTQDRNALMYAYYSGHVPKLGQDDINGIRRLYGYGK